MDEEQEDLRGASGSEDGVKEAAEGRSRGVPTEEGHDVDQEVAEEHH